MKVFWLLICFLNIVCCKKERLSDLYDMLKDPDFLQEIEKRINSLDDDVDRFSDNQVGCYDNSGLLASGCSFHVNGSAIIKTDESLQRGAEFLDDFVNVTCPKDCTSLCCKNKDCDTAVYQDKGDRKCYLFRCGDSSSCVFSHHSNYSVSSISKAAYKSHSYSPGGATHSHENELENLGSHNKGRTTTLAPVSSTTVTTVAHARMKLPELGEYCTSYLSRCEDPHAECMRQTCQCRVGYHSKHDICRKHCRDEEFECEKVYDADSRQCILTRYVCDGHSDCSDGSDEENCPDKSKEAFLDRDGNNNFYHNPFFSSQYSQSDSQFPYGFPIPGLTNQQQNGLYQPANQIYQGQGTANQNTAGQYFVPGLTNQNQGGINLIPASNQQWPLGNSIGSQVYQNNVPFQTGQQQNYIPAQTGFVQNPIQPIQPVKTNVQPVQQNVVQRLPQVQSNQVPGGVMNQNLGSIQKVATPEPVNKPAAQKNKNPAQIEKMKDQDTGYLLDHFYNTVTETEEAEEPKDRFPFSMSSQNDNLPSAFDNDNADRDDKIPAKADVSDFTYHNGRVDNGAADIVEDDDLEDHRHSSEEDEDTYSRGRTYPPATKTKTQIASPTQSTVADHKSGQSHSEGFPDYSWLKYDDDSPRVSGKKGKIPSSHVSDLDTDSGKKLPVQSSIKSDGDKLSKVPDTKPESHDTQSVKTTSGSKYKSDKFGDGRFNTDNKYPDDYRFQYEDYRRPNNNRRPSYDRYQNRYENSRRRPSPGTRYPYYDSGYQRGWDRDRDQNHYPVWDPYKDEYYYPDVYDDRHLSHSLDYDSQSEEKPSHNRPLDSGSKNGIFPLRPDKPKNTVIPSTTHKTTENVEVHKTTTTPRPVTQKPTYAEPQVPSDTEKADVPNKDNDSQASSDTDQTDTQEPVSSEQEAGDQSVNESSSGNSGVTEKEGEKTEKGYLEILNADAVEVESYTDSSQGPIVALALGLAITMILLIFVGCRLRTVKRRLRKGRALHSNEADYLINGMYL